MTASPAAIYKLLLAPEWEAFQAAASFTGSPVDLRDGFIHFSTRDQVVETAARHFESAAEVVLLEIAPEKLPKPLAWEPSRGGQFFPHLYAALPLTAVTRRWTLRREQDGALRFPEL